MGFDLSEYTKLLKQGVDETLVALRDGLRHGIPGFKAGYRLGKAYLKTLGKSNRPVMPLEEEKYVDKDSYAENEAYRKGTRAGIDSAVLSHDLKTYVKEGYTYDTGPTNAEVKQREAYDAPPPSTRGSKK